MTDKPARVFIGQAKEHTGKYGKYLTLRLGLATVFLEPSKQDGLYNAYIKEAPPKEDRPSQQGHHDKHADDGKRIEVGNEWPF